MFQSRPDINKENILEMISQEEVFERYLGRPVEFDTLFCSTLREDPNPTCSFKWIGNKLYYRDWTEAKAKDCFDIVKYLYQCNFSEALDIVARDFNLIEGENKQPERKPRPRSKEPANIQIASQGFTTYCIQYWESQGIHLKTLEQFDVTSVRAVWVRGVKIYDWRKDDLAFAYKFGNGLTKIYFPNRKKGQLRFLNPDNSIVEGFNKLPETGEILLITKSYKDVMAAFELLSLSSISPASETVILNSLIIDILRSRFKYIFSLMDNDAAGITAAKELKKLGIPPLLFPRHEPKDLTDNYVKYGSLYLLDIMEDLKQRLCR